MAPVRTREVKSQPPHASPRLAGAQRPPGAHDTPFWRYESVFWEFSLFGRFCWNFEVDRVSGPDHGLWCQNVAQNVGHRRKFDQQSEKTRRNVQILQIIKNGPYISRMMYYGPQGGSGCQRGAGFSVEPSFWPRCLTIRPHPRSEISENMTRKRKLSKIAPIPPE